MRYIGIFVLIISFSACNLEATPAPGLASATPSAPTVATSTGITPSAVKPLPAAVTSPSGSTLSGSQPTPVPLSEASFLVRQANGLTIARHIAYVTSWEGLHLLDISEPAAPYQLGFYPTPNQSAAGVAVAGDRAYIMAIGLHIVDVSNPTAPRRLGFYQPPPAPISAPAVAGNTVYLAAWETGLIIVDVSDLMSLDR